MFECFGTVDQAVQWDLLQAVLLFKNSPADASKVKIERLKNLYHPDFLEIQTHAYQYDVAIFGRDDCDYTLDEIMRTLLMMRNQPNGSGLVRVEKQPKLNHPDYLVIKTPEVQIEIVVTDLRKSMGFAGSLEGKPAAMLTIL